MAKIFNAAQNPTLTNNSGNCLPDCNGGDRKMNESLKTEFCVVGGGLAVTRWAASSSLDAPRGPASLRDFPLMMAAVLLWNGMKDHQQLADLYSRSFGTGTEHLADLLVRVRSDKESDYLFVINDKRTFGDYVGQYGLIMEKGLPNSGTVSVRRKCQVIYDLLTGKTVPFSVKDGITVIPVNFRTNDGKILLLMDSPVTAVELQMAEKAEKGGTVPFSVRLKTADGKYLKALHPLRVEVRDPKNVLTDDSTWAALTDGVYKSRITIPLNGEQGLWNVTVRDPASGKSAVGKLQVQ